MKNNLNVLSEVIEDFIDIPFFLLPEERQKHHLEILRGMFFGLQEDFTKNGTVNTPIGEVIQNICQIFQEEKFNEYKLANNLKNLLVKLEIKEPDSNVLNLLQNIEKLAKRAQPFWTSEKEVLEQKIQLDLKQIKRHDLEILEKEMQLYSLDYFLMIYKLLSGADFDKQKEIIFHGHEKLPALIDDALKEDMLDKIVYKLFDSNLRYQMMRDYYLYKTVFLFLKKSENEINQENIQKIIQGLRNYCLTLLITSIENGIQNMKYGLYYPYGENKSLVEIKKILS